MVHRAGEIAATSPRGRDLVMSYREDTSDLSVILSHLGGWGNPAEDEYRLAEYSPRTFLDIGAHVGAVTVALLADNPDAYGIALEPLAENCELIQRNLEQNGLADRATVLNGKIGNLPITYNPREVERYVAGPSKDGEHAPEVETYSLHSLVGDGIDLLKIDCEGCEWVALSDPAVARIEHITGEYHGDPEDVIRLLEATHDLRWAPLGDGGTGNFWAVRR